MAEKEKGKRAGDERAGGSRPDDHRRKWDLAEYEKAAKAREDVEKAMNRDRSDEYEPKIKRDLLRIREYKVDLDSRLGRSHHRTLNCDGQTNIDLRLSRLFHRTRYRSICTWVFLL